VKEMSKPITQKRIADELGVSIMTVSKALGNKKGVGKDTSLKIKKLASELNYKPNLIARSLQSSQTKTLGLVISDINMSLVARTVEEIDRVASETGYHIILSNMFSESPESERNAIETLMEKRVDGLLLIASVLTDSGEKEYFDSLDIPYIFLVRKPSFESNFVVNDNYFGAYQMIEHLIEKNQREVFFINMHGSIPASKDRLRGYKDALTKNGIKYDTALVFEAKPAIEAGYGCMKKILTDYKNVKAVFCGCDMIAIGAMECIRDHGLSIPDGIKIASYDDIEFAEYLFVPLTTVRQPMEKIGQVATEILGKQIKEKEKEYEGSSKYAQIVIKPEIIIRKST
jgi:DNA-binding LacI/PurR family transcriptional regulator